MTSPAIPLTLPSPSELPVQETERALVAYVDSRINQLDANVDKRFDRLDADMKGRLTKQDEMMLRQDAKLDVLIEFRPATEQRLKAIEDEITLLKQRPMRSWQAISGGIGLAFVLVSTVVSVIYDTITILTR